MCAGRSRRVFKENQRRCFGPAKKQLEHLGIPRMLAPLQRSKPLYRGSLRFSPRPEGKRLPTYLYFNV